MVTLADHPAKSGALSELDRAIDDAVRLGLAVVVANMTDPQLMADPAAHRGRSLTDARDLAAAIDQQVRPSSWSPSPSLRARSI